MWATVQSSQIVNSTPYSRKKIVIRLHLKYIIFVVVLLFSDRQLKSIFLKKLPRNFFLIKSDHFLTDRLFNIKPKIWRDYYVKKWFGNGIYRYIMQLANRTQCPKLYTSLVSCTMFVYYDQALICLIHFFKRCVSCLIKRSV